MASLNFTVLGPAGTQTFTVSQAGSTQAFTVASKNLAICTVSPGNGIFPGPMQFAVTPLSAGLTSVSIQSADGSSASVDITVTEAPIMVTTP